jgi:aspartyl-tRNA(Asn)/glutamyl-tRNA(Gln) amidotransferase subunit A
LTYRFLDLEGCRKALKEDSAAYLKFVNEALSEDKHQALREKLSVSTQATGALKDIPLIIKDNISLEGQIVGCASKYLENHRAHFTATVLERLLQQGCQVLGRSNMDEFAMGSSTEQSAYGPTLNPWNKKCVPGGSSGGSAALVAEGIVPVALGSDTGGSVRQPAAFCGVVGYKPSYGTLSRYGLVAFSSSLDQIGIFSHRVEDCAELMSYMAGHDERDSTSLKSEQSWDLSDVDVSKLKVGVLPDSLLKGLQPEIADSLEETKEWFRKEGAEIVTCEMPHFEMGVPVYYVVALAEASTNLSRYDGIRYGQRAEAKDLADIFLRSRQQNLGTEVKRRILMGTHVLSSGYYDAYYGKARIVQTLIKKDFDQAFSQMDVMLWPTTPTTAYELGEKNSPVEVYLSDIFTVCCNLAALPSISLPTALDNKGLPIGLQLTGAFGEDNKLLSVAAAFQKENRFEKRPEAS